MTHRLPLLLAGATLALLLLVPPSRGEEPSSTPAQKPPAEKVTPAPSRPAPAPRQAAPEPSSVATPAKAETPAAVVHELDATLLDVMKHASSLGYDGRVAKLAPVLRKVFDFPYMARLSAGLHWNALDPSQRTKLVEAFSGLSIATYAARFDGYDGERFEVLSSEPSIQNTVIVHSKLVKSDGKPVVLDYRLHPADGGWKIVDVFLDGTVSELALRRAEYSSVIRRQGFDALLRILKQKTADQKPAASS